MARIDGVNPDAVDGYAQRVFSAQAKSWGGPLLNHLLYARRPTIFKAARGMWGGLGGSGLVDPSLIGLVNRRIAAHNGCVF